MSVVVSDALRQIDISTVFLPLNIFQRCPKNGFPLSLQFKADIICTLLEAAASP
jgi:hypothetical protein